MKKIFLLLVLTAALAACTTTGKPKKGLITDSKCGSSTRGRTDASVTYRVDSKFEISMKLKWDAGHDSEFRIKLKPKRGTHSAVVTTTGKSGTLPDGSSTPFAWMNKSGTAEKLTDKTLILCIPKDVPIGTEYKFDINIAGIGTIDPRVRVTY